MADPKYKAKLNRLANVIVQEIMDGCLDCREQGSLCSDHWKEVADMILHPKRSRLAEEAKNLKKGD